MFLAEVIGTVVAPVTIPILQGQTQLLVRPLSPTGERFGGILRFPRGCRNFSPVAPHSQVGSPPWPSLPQSSPPQADGGA